MTQGLQKLKVFDPGNLPSNAGQMSAQEVEPDYWRPVITLTAVLIFCGLMSSLYAQVRAWLDQPVIEVRVLGETRFLNKRTLAHKLAAGINRPLLDFDLAALHAQVVDEPWIHKASVRRDWPPAIEVKIDEQIPVARWGSNGLLNHQGDIFWPQDHSSYPALPELEGPTTETQYLMAQYHALSPLFKGANVKMTGLYLEARGAWSLQLDNGIKVIVGREQVRDRLLRFIRLYQNALAPHAANIDTVDIRYINGAAVKWRNLPPVMQEEAG